MSLLVLLPRLKLIGPMSRIPVCEPLDVVQPRIKLRLLPASGYDEAKGI